jgi:hypothetical protein
MFYASVSLNEVRNNESQRTRGHVRANARWWKRLRARCGSGALIEKHRLKNPQYDSLEPDLKQALVLIKPEAAKFWEDDLPLLFSQQDVKLATQVTAWLAQARAYVAKSARGEELRESLIKILEDKRAEITKKLTYVPKMFPVFGSDLRNLELYNFALDLAQACHKVMLSKNNAAFPEMNIREHPTQ